MNPPFLAHNYGKAAHAPNCLDCLTPKAQASGECSVRLRAALNEALTQAAQTRADIDAVLAAQACTCISGPHRRHTDSCPARAL